MVPAEGPTDVTMQAADLLTREYLANPLLSWVTAGVVAVAALLAFLAIRRSIRRYLNRGDTDNGLEMLRLSLEVAAQTSTLFLWLAAALIGLSTLTTVGRADRVLDSAIAITLFWQAGAWVSEVTSRWFERKQRAGLEADRARFGSLSVISLIVRGVIWAVVVLLTLDNLGVNITALVAGLGIGGVAVALAVQNVLGDLFASLSIALDKPFVVGDFLSIGEFLGSVEYIGIKSTRLRSLSGEQIVISNADLLGSRIRNFGRMAERRIVFTLNIAYETSADLLERIPREIRTIVESQPHTRFDRSHFSSYGPHSLDFETVYYVLTADYNRYMDTQQAINLLIFRRFQRLGAEFAYPTQQLYLTRKQSVDAETEQDTSPLVGTHR